MKKTMAIFMALLLSVTLLIPQVVGISTLVSAQEFLDGDDDDQDIPDDPDPTEAPTPDPTEAPTPDPTEAPTPDPTDPPAPDPTEAPAPDPTEAPTPDPTEAPDPAVTPAPAPDPATDPAQQEAQRKAQEEAEAAKKAAEEAAKKAAEEAATAYSLTISMGGASVSSIDFATAPVGTQRDYKVVTVTNTGQNAFDLITTKLGDANGAFSLSLRGSNTHLGPNDSADYIISMRSDLPAGDYDGMFLFGAASDPKYDKALGLKVKGTVSSNPSGVTAVEISPSRIYLSVGATSLFNADVRGVGDFDKSVSWSVTGNRSTGTKIIPLNQDGVANTGELSVAMDESSPSLTVIAVSADNPRIVGYANINIQSDSYNVSASASPANGGRVTGGGAVKKGGSVTLSAIPNGNFFFRGWVRDGQTVSTATNYTINNIQSDINVTAQFDQQIVKVTLNKNDDDGGSVTGGGTFNVGDSTRIEAKAYSGYAFTGWKENDTIVSRDSSIKLTNLTVDRKLTAVFKRTKNTVTLVVDPVDSGDVSGGGTFDLGDSTTVKASPRSGYDFIGWYVNGSCVSRDKEYKISKIEQDYTLTALFQKQGITSFEISSGVATTGGSISPSGKLLVAKGQNMTYTITPKSGFAILAVAVDGVMVGPVSTYTFTNVQGPHMIAAAFVQTDAGKKKQESSGQPVQEQKVQPIKKTESNTATSTSTVGINEAANGQGGDNYVEDMDLKDIHVPSDEELGIEVVPDTVDSGVTRLLGASYDEVANMVASGNIVPVFDAAFYSGELGAYVKNDLAPKSMEGVDYQNMSEEELMMLSDDSINPSLPDLDIVVEKMLSNDEILAMVKGGHVDISVSLTKMDPDPAAEKIMKNAIGQKPLQFFDLTMLKTAGGFTERVNEIPTTMEVVVEIPDEIYEEGKTYSVLRVHQGELSILPDLDDNPRTITFRTDRFSAYAISKEVTTSSKLIGWLIAGGAIALGIALTCFLILIVHQAKWKRARRKHG